MRVLRSDICNCILKAWRTEARTFGKVKSQIRQRKLFGWRRLWCLIWDYRFRAVGGESLFLPKGSGHPDRTHSRTVQHQEQRNGRAVNATAAAAAGEAARTLHMLGEGK